MEPKQSSSFTVDDIHNLRVQISEQRRSMSKEEAERDIAKHAENAKKAIEKIRKEKDL